MTSLGENSFCEREDSTHAFQSAYHNALNSVWPKLPNFIQSLIATIIIVMAGISLNGEWIHIFSHLVRYMREAGNTHLYIVEHFSDKFKDLPNCLLTSVCVNCGFYLVLCCYLQWYFYIRQKETPEQWKCQPKKFLSWKDEKHEIILGTSGAIQASITSGIVSCYVNNGGHSTLYYNISEYGRLYFLVSIPLFFLYTESLLYYAHRLLHYPAIYKSIHKYHHRYKQPTPFSTLAMHPLELFLDQAIVFVPTFIVPLHFAVFFSVLIYNYYYNILSHSGIKLDSIWPWQCNTFFHDDHHKFFHVNFGVNTSIMDKLHGTYRQKNRIYNENTFYGRGKSINEATQEELADHAKNS